MAFEAPGSSVLSYRLVRPDGRVVGRGRLDVVVDAPAEVAATASSTAAEDAALDLVYGAPDLEPPAPRGPVTLMAQVTGGARFGGPDPGGMATFWMGATARFTDVVNLDFGPWVAWHHPTLEAADGRNAGVDLFPLHLRAALAFDLGVARPYFGASGGLQFLRLGESASALGIVADEVQLGWDAFAGVGFAFGPGHFVFEVDYGSIALSGASPAADLGGVAVLGGYRFSD
jgi:hypothetical protein